MVPGKLSFNIYWITNHRSLGTTVVPTHNRTLSSRAWNCVLCKIEVCRCLYFWYMSRWLWAFSSLGSCSEKVNKEPWQSFIPHSAAGLLVTCWLVPDLPWPDQSFKGDEGCENTCVGGFKAKGMQRSVRQGLWLLLGGLRRLPTCSLLLTPLSCSSFHSGLCTVQGNCPLQLEPSLPVTFI